MTVENGKAMLSFDYVGGGLAASDDKPLTWFTIAGADGKFYPAAAEIVGDKLAVSSPAVPAPTVVHFAWDEGARPNFVNKAGLPASPFRTDNPFLAGR
jgi:sialate O-acetylesterase